MQKVYAIAQTTAIKGLRQFMVLDSSVPGMYMRDIFTIKGVFAKEPRNKPTEYCVISGGKQVVLKNGALYLL